MEKVGVLVKVADIMDLLSSTREPLSVSELARRLDMPRATLHRLITAMEEQHLVESSHGRLRPGIRLVRWANEAWESSDLRRLAHPVLEAIVRETGETAALFVRVGTERICLDRVEGSGLLRSVTRIGESSPLHLGSSGKVLLAFSPRKEWPELLRESRARFPDEPARDLPDLDLIRASGYVISTGDRDDALSSLSVPVFGQTGAVCAALSISGPNSRLTVQRLEACITMLHDAAKQLHAALRRQPVRGQAAKRP